MKIEVGEMLYIESDGLQFMLKQYTGKVKKDNSEVYKTLGYFGSLNALVKRLVQIKVMNSEAASIRELLENLSRIEKEIDELIKI